MKMSPEIEVALVIVLFNPDADDLRHALEMAKECRGVIVDNSPRPSFSGESVGQMLYLCSGRNVGIAEAQNTALKVLMSGQYTALWPRFTHFVFLDQDSRTQPEFPAQMAAEFEQAQQYLAENCSESTQKLAILGPTIINKLTGETYSSAFHAVPEGSAHFIPSREVISSGACISRAALEEVGLNDETLFIDMVDHEWCWRALSCGWVVGTTPQLQLPHLVGRKPLQIGRHTILRAAPLRHYYLCRNYLLLCSRQYVPRQWKWAMGIKRLAATIIVPLTQPDGFRALSYMWRGMLDGLRGKGGKM